MKASKQSKPTAESSNGAKHVPFLQRAKGLMYSGNKPSPPDQEIQAKTSEQSTQDSIQVTEKRKFSVWDQLKSEFEKKQMAEYLQQNRPLTLGWFKGPDELAKRFLDEEQLDKSNVEILKSRNIYFMEELKKIEIWLKFKEDLTQTKRETLNLNKEKIIKILSTPLSLNPKVDVTMFFVTDMKEEIPRIMAWIEANPNDEAGGRMVENMQKMLILMQLNENPPGYWGIQMKTKEKFLNIKAPGCSAQTLAFYFYGDVSKRYLIRKPDGTPIPDFLETGKTVLFDSATFNDHTKIVHQTTEPWLKVDGAIPDFDQSVDQYINVELAGKSYEVPHLQYNALIVNVFDTKKKQYEIEIEYMEKQLKVYSDIRGSTYKFVRVYSEHFGDASFDAEYFRGIIKKAKNYYATVSHFSSAEVNPELVNQLHSKLKILKNDGEILVDDISEYFNKSVEGAATAIQGLEYAKAAGNIASAFVPGLGIVYGGIQDAAQQASGLAHGTQQNWNFKSTAREFAIGLASHGIGKAAGAGFKAAGSTVAKVGAKYAPKAMAQASKLGGSLARASSTTGGRFISGFAQNMAENVVTSPLISQVDKLVTEGRFATYDEMIKDLGDQFSLQNLLTAGATSALAGKTPMDIHLAGKNDKNLPTRKDVFQPAVLGKKTKAGEPTPVQEPTGKSTPAQEPAEATGDAKQAEATPAKPQHGQIDTTPTTVTPKAPTPPTPKPTEPKDNVHASQENTEPVKPRDETGDFIQLEAGDVVRSPDLPSSITIYNNMMKEQPTLEVAIFHNQDTGETIVVQGAENVVGVRSASGKEFQSPSSALPQPMREILDHPDTGRWELQSHYHPLVDASGEAPTAYRFPSGEGGDFTVLQNESMAAGNIARGSYIHYQTQQGVKATHFKFDPKASNPYSIIYFDPATNKTLRDEFATLNDYQAWATTNFGFDPNPAPIIDSNPTTASTKGSPKSPNNNTPQTPSSSQQSYRILDNNVTQADTNLNPTPEDRIVPNTIDEINNGVIAGKRPQSDLTRYEVITVSQVTSKEHRERILQQLESTKVGQKVDRIRDQFIVRQALLADRKNPNVPNTFVTNDKDIYNRLLRFATDPDVAKVETVGSQKKIEERLKEFMDKKGIKSFLIDIDGAQMYVEPVF